MNIRFWAGTSYNNKSEAPFVVTENGSLFAKDGYFSGTINAKNSYFQGTIYSSNFLLKNSENFVFKINDNENIYDLLTINKDKTIFSNNIFVNSNNFPLFYTILQEKTVVANSFKIFNTSEIVNNFIYGLFFNNNKISFYGIDNVNNTLKNYEDVNTNLFLNDNNYFSIVIDNNNNNNGIFINKDFNIYGENHKIISFSKSTELETNNSIVKVHGNLYFSENIIIKQSKNGLNFIVLKENN